MKKTIVVLLIFVLTLLFCCKNKEINNNDLNNSNEISSNTEDQDDNKTENPDNNSSENPNDDNGENEIPKAFYVECYLNGELYERFTTLPGKTIPLPSITKAHLNFTGWIDSETHKVETKVTLDKDYTFYGYATFFHPRSEADIESSPINPNCIIENELFFELYPLVVGSELDLHFSESRPKTGKVGIGYKLEFARDEEGLVIGFNEVEDAPFVVDENLHFTALKAGVYRMNILTENFTPEKSHDEYSQQIIIYPDYATGVVHLETDRKMEDYKCMIYGDRASDSEFYNYVFSYGEKIGTSFVLIDENNNIVRTKETDEYKITNTKYNIRKTTTGLYVDITDDGVITAYRYFGDSSGGVVRVDIDEIYDVSVFITTTVLNKVTNEEKNYYHVLGLYNMDAEYWLFSMYKKMNEE